MLDMVEKQAQHGSDRMKTDLQGPDRMKTDLLGPDWMKPRNRIGGEPDPRGAGRLLEAYTPSLVGSYYF